MVRRTAVMVLGALAIVASVFRFTAAPGPGLDPDALSYLGAARSLANDGALRIPTAPWWSDSATAPLAHFPPGYSAVLAVPIALGADARLAARLVQSAAAGITVAVLMLALWPVTGAWGAVLGVLAVVLSPAFALVHLSVLSEPLFLALVALALWSFVRRPRAALTHGIIAAAATMVRYAGLSVAAAAALWALRDRSAPWRERVQRAALALAPSLLAMMTWSLTRPRAPGQAAPIRQLAFYGHLMPTLREGARTVAHLLVPSLEWEPVPTLAAVGTLVALAALVWSTMRAPDDTTPADTGARATGERALLEAAGILALCYAVLVVASRALADPDIPFDFRLAVPLVPLAVVAVSVVAARAWRVISAPARVFGVLAVAAWSAVAIRTGYEQVDYALTEGNDFAGRDWRESPTLAWARAQDSTRAIYTNWPCAIWFHLDRRARDLPGVTDDRTLRDFVARLRASGGAVVAWSVQSPETAPTDSIVARAGLVRVATFSDGAVFAAPPATPTATAPVALPVAPAAAHR